MIYRINILSPFLARIQIEPVHKLIYKQLKLKYKDMVRASKMRGLSCSLSFDAFCRKMLKGCYYCGVNTLWLSGYSIDRKDSDLGYTKTNSVACCRECNLLKSRQSFTNFKKFLSLFVGSSKKRAQLIKLCPGWKNKDVLHRIRPTDLTFVLNLHSLRPKERRFIYEAGYRKVDLYLIRLAFKNCIKTKTYLKYCKAL